MKKVVGIESAKKPDEPCQFCGATPACPALTCPRIRRLELSDDGSVAVVEYFENWRPRDPAQ